MLVHAAFELIEECLDLSLLSLDRCLGIVSEVDHFRGLDHLQDLQIDVSLFVATVCDLVQLILE